MQGWSCTGRAAMGDGGSGRGCVEKWAWLWSPWTGLRPERWVGGAKNGGGCDLVGGRDRCPQWWAGLQVVWAWPHGRGRGYRQVPDPLGALRYLPLVGHTDGTLAVLDLFSWKTTFRTDAHCPHPIMVIASTWNNIVTSGQFQQRSLSPVVLGQYQQRSPESSHPITSKGHLNPVTPCRYEQRSPEPQSPQVSTKAQPPFLLLQEET